MAANLRADIILGGRVNASLKNAFRYVKTAAAVGTAAIAAGLAYTAKRALGLASDLNEVQNVVDTTFQKDAGQINTWSKSAKNAFGLAELQAKQYTGTMGAMLKSSGIVGKNMVTMSTNLTGLAGDFSSFYNISQDAAWEKIRAGISGETEPLRQLGINMTVANLEAYALSKGIKTSYQNMGQAAQTALRYSYLMEKSKDAQGDFAKTQGSFANQARLAKVNFDQMIATMAQNFLPIATKVIAKANNIMGSISNPTTMAKINIVMVQIGVALEGAFTKAQPAINWLIYTGIPTAYGVLTQLLSIAGDISSFFVNNWSLIGPIVWGIVAAFVAYNAAVKYGFIIQALTAAWRVAATAITMYRNGATIATIAQWALNGAMSANPIGIVILAIGALVAAIVYLYQNWDSISSAIVGIWSNNVLPFFEGLGSFFSNLWGNIIAIIKAAANTMIKPFNSVIDGVNSVIGAVGKFTGLKFKLPHIPTFAHGGFANQPSIFGEAGMEAAIPIKRNNHRSIALLNQTAQMLGVGGGNTFIINVYPQSGEARGIGEAVRDVIEEYFRNKGRVSFAA